MGRSEASLDDVERVYTGEILSVRGQVHLEHYETRLRSVLGTLAYSTALELLTEAAVNNGLLRNATVGQYRQSLTAVKDADTLANPTLIEDLLHLLEHDGYLERQDDGYRFVSGLVEDWWRGRHGQHFVPISERVN